MVSWRQGAWPESSSQCVWNRPIIYSLTRPRLSPFPFPCGHLPHILDITMAISLSCTPPFPTHSMLDPHHVYSPTPSCTMVSNVPLLSQVIPSASSCSFWSTSCFTLEEPSEAAAFHVSLLARLPLILRVQLRLCLALYPSPHSHLLPQL